MSTTAQQEVNTPASVTTGDFVWHELRTTDAKGAEAFYTHVIGWKTKDSGDPGGIPYKLFSVGGLDTAGMMELKTARSTGNWHACIAYSSSRSSESTSERILAPV